MRYFEDTWEQAYHQSTMKRFEINLSNVMYDKTLQSIQKHFSRHKDLYQDQSLLCPPPFSKITQNGVPRRRAELSKSKSAIESPV